MSDQEYETEQEVLDDLLDSLTHAIHVLSAITSDIATGEYSQEKAVQDYENIMWNEGIDFMTSLESYATWTPTNSVDAK